MFTHILRSAARTTTRKCSPYSATKNRAWQRGRSLSERSFSNHANQATKKDLSLVVDHIKDLDNNLFLSLVIVTGTVYVFCGGQDEKLDRMERKIETLESSIKRERLESWASK